MMKTEPNPSQRMNKFICLCFLFCAFTQQIFAQPGKDGALTVTAANTVVNCYSAVTANVTAGTNTVSINSAADLCGLTCGDLIMIYQAQGATINTANNNTYGTITAMNGAGLYEFNYVVSIVGTTITVQNNWGNSYTAIGSGYAQIIKVPQYTNLTINTGASIVATPWQQVATRRFGGIVAIHATGTITVNGTIQTYAQGFRGGQVENNTSGAGATVYSDFVTTNSSLSAEKGESIAGFLTDYDAMGGRYGRGAPANGGGGGNAHNAGGGGGSNASNGNAYNGNGVMCTACTGAAAWNLDPFFISTGALANSSGGGRGGHTYGASNQNALTVAPSAAAWGGDQRDPSGGFGGKPLTATAASRIFFGGGGGAGDMNNNAGLPAGNGGGIIYLIANNVNGTGNIRAGGSDGQNQIALGTACANDAPAGGGGGGSIIVKSGAMAGTLTLNASGGKGSDQNNLPTESEGPGGGGGGGFIAISTGAPTINVSGGANGITLSGSLTEFPANGATSGASGQSTTVANTFITYVSPIPVIVTTSNSPVCTGQTINFTTTTLAGATYAWSGPAAFTSAAQNPTRPGATLPMAGTYQVIYTSAGGCKDTNTTDVVVHPTPIVSGTGVDPLCNGDCNGSATVNITTGGTPAYSFLWSNGALTQTASSLCAGTFNVTVTDIFNCTATTSVTLTNPPVLSATATFVQPACNGSCNGSITVNATGGTAPYNYSVDGGAFQVSNVLSSLCSGTHVVTVRDSKNCLFTFNVIVTQPAVLTVAVVTNTPSTCAGSNGSLTFSAAGGTTAYSFSLDGGAGQASGTFNSLAAGSHTVIVTDAHGCTATTTVTVNNASAPTATVLSQQNVTCFGGANGSVLIGAVGGTAPFLYRRVPLAFGASNLFSSLTAGTYTFEVQDNNGCVGSVVVTITQPTQLNYTATPVVPASCFGACDGTIMINPAGGTPPYTFSSNNGLSFSTTNPINGLCAGNVFVVVKDANGCLANSIVAITQPAALNATYTLTNPLCPNVCNGQIVVATTTGGTTPYQYSVNGGALGASNTLPGLCNGPNTVLVQDAHGCQLSSTQMLVDPPLFTVTQTSMVESNCGFPNGSFEIQASGGAAPYNYHNVATGTNQPNGIYTGLPSGAYEIEVTDNNGCMQTFFAGINDIEMDGILDGFTDITCHAACDGTFLSHATGGIPPITFEIDGNGSFDPDGNFTGLCAGSHIVVMVDNGFCVYTLPFTLVEPDEIFFTLTPTNIACNGGTTGSITVTGVTGGNGVYQYSINGGPFQASNVFNTLTAGTHTVTVQDGNGCTGVFSTTITQAAPLTFTVNVSDLTCFNNNTGFLQIVAAGGTPGYTYSFNGGPFGASFTFFPLAAGTYNFTIRDNNSCTVTSSATISQPAPLAANYTTTAPLCNGSCDGEISVNASGGTTPYMYSSDGGLSYGVISNITGLCAGSHNIVVKDSNNCQIGTSLNLIDPAALVFGTNVNNATCGNNNGQIQVVGVSGGTGVYMYAIDGSTPQASNTFGSLAPDDYTITLSDGNGCTIDGLATVNDEASPTLVAAIGVNPLCNGSCNGTVAITASGGTGTLQYSLNAGPLQASPNFSGLCAGTYTATVTDANGCTDATTFTLTDPATLIYLNPTVVNLSCFQNNTGSISFDTTLFGGTPPYLFSYNGGTPSASPNLNFIAAGTYTIDITDFHGCTTNGTATVTEPTQLVLNGTTSTVPNVCFGACQAEIHLVPAGGTTNTPGIYSYLWTPAVASTNSPNALNLCAGTYDVTVQDANGCTLDTSFTFTEPLPFEVTDLDWTDISCNIAGNGGTCNGTITVTAPTGVGFSLNGAAPQASNNFAALCPGVYNIAVVDNNGCIANAVVTIVEPAPLTIVTTLDTVICINDTLPLFGLGVGGTAPYTYTWLPAIPGSPDPTAPNQEVVVTGNSSYSVSVTDANSCFFGPATINVTVHPLMNASVSPTPDTTVCSGSPVTFTASAVDGVAPYHFEWTPTDTLASYTVTPTVPGTYSVIVTDQCADTETLSVNVLFFPQPSVNFGATGATSGCSPLVVPFMNLTPVGQIGASPCQWFIDGVAADTSCDTLSLTFLDPGCHDVSLTIVSPDGCSQNFEQTDLVCVFPDPVAQYSTTSDPNPPTILQSDISYVNLSTNSVSYVWTFPDGSVSFAPNPIYNFEPDTAGNYEVCLIATSPDGCLDTTCQLVFIQDVLLLYVPNAFTPDGDGVNDQFYPVITGADKEEYGFMIFDRWGELIFQSNTLGVGWDGTHKGVKCKEDVYVWKLKFRDKVEGVNKEYYGHVTLLQ